MKKIVYGSEAREGLLRGLTIIERAVKVTLGPSGSNVLMRHKGEARPYSTKDGVTVAREVGSNDALEMMAIESVQDVANKSDEVAGDGTTTATVLAAAIFREGFKLSQDLNRLDLKRGIDKAVELIVDKLAEVSIDVEGNDEMLRQVALISSNNDHEIADLVVDAYKAAGKQGVVNIKRSRTYKTFLSTIQGMNLPMGYNSPYFVTNSDTETCEFDETYVYMSNEPLMSVSKNFNKLLETANEEMASLLIIVPKIDDVVTSMLVQNAMKANFKVCVCVAPDFGDEQVKTLGDIACALGKPAFILGDGIQFNDLSEDEVMQYIPKAKGVSVGLQFTSIKGVAGTKEYRLKVREEMEKRAESLRNKIEITPTPYEKQNLNMRISRLTDGVAYINLGAYSDTEFIEKQHRVNDSLHATKNAVQEGIIPGGGTTLLSLSESVKFKGIENKSFIEGFNIVLRAIKKPFFQIIDNVGVEICDKEIKACIDEMAFGYDARNKIFVKNMIEKGIIDPVKVTRTALQNAGSIAGMLLTTECVLVDTSVYSTEKSAMNPFG